MRPAAQLCLLCLAALLLAVAPAAAARDLRLAPGPDPDKSNTWCYMHMPGRCYNNDDCQERDGQSCPGWICYGASAGRAGSCRRAGDSRRRLASADAAPDSGSSWCYMHMPSYCYNDDECQEVCPGWTCNIAVGAHKGHCRSTGGSRRRLASTDAAADKSNSWCYMHRPEYCYNDDECQERDGYACPGWTCHKVFGNQKGSCRPPGSSRRRLASADGGAPGASDAWCRMHMIKFCYNDGDCQERDGKSCPNWTCDGGSGGKQGQCRKH